MRYLQARKALDAPLKSVAFYSKCMHISDLFSARARATSDTDGLKNKKTGKPVFCHITTTIT